MRKLRGFDSNFWIAILIAVPTISCFYLFSHYLYSNFGIHWIFSFLGFIGVLYFGLILFENRLKNILGNEIEPVNIDWSTRINETSFPIDDEIARYLKEVTSKSLESLQNETIVCVTICPKTIKDYFFEGKVVKNQSGQLLIEAVNEDELPQH